MSLYKEALSQGPVGKYKARRTRNRSRWRDWAKNQMNRWIRRQKVKLEDGAEKPKFIGYE